MIFIITPKAVLITVAETIRDDEINLLQSSVLRQECADPLDGKSV